jgi:hypothetical protein
MASPDGVENRHRVLWTAQAYIYQNYLTGVAIYANDFNTRKSWFTWKRVAHLCAAFVDFLPYSASVQIDDQTLASLEQNMASFASTALHYQRFLTGQCVIEGAEIPFGTRKSFKLALLPKLNLIAQPFTKSELPKWDRRPKRAAIVGDP